MKQQFIVGIDGGTQSSKVAIFDLNGEQICAATQALRPLHQPRPGVAEHPGDDLWESIARACQAAMDAFPYEPTTILGVGLCTIRCCRAALTEDGRLAGPVLNWMDRRLGERYEWSDPAVHYLTTSSGYIGFRMTGEMKDTAANYEGQWPLDKQAWQWSSEAAVQEQHALRPENLFDLVLPGEVLGRVTPEAARESGLPAGLPVVATANDKAVEALGAGLAGGQTGLISLGTYIGGMVYGDHYVEQASHYFSNLACIPGRYLYESGGIRHGMGTISWFSNLPGDGAMDIQLLNVEARAVAAGCDGLLSIPEWLAPQAAPYKRGAMLGFHTGHTRAHIYRSLLESIALTMKNNLHRMCVEADVSINEIVLSGGGAHSDLFMQIFADVFALPTRRPRCIDAVSLGSAMCAAVAAGVVNDFDEAIATMSHSAEGFTPQPENTEIYDALNSQVFEQLCEQTDPIFKRVHSILERP